LLADLGVVGGGDLAVELDKPGVDLASHCDDDIGTLAEGF